MYLHDTGRAAFSQVSICKFCFLFESFSPISIGPIILLDNFHWDVAEQTFFLLELQQALFLLQLLQNTLGVGSQLLFQIPNLGFQRFILSENFFSSI